MRETTIVRRSTRGRSEFSVAATLMAIAHYHARRVRDVAHSIHALVVQNGLLDAPGERQRPFPGPSPDLLFFSYLSLSGRLLKHAMEAERTGSPRQTLLSWGPILLASWLLLLAATCRPAGAAPRAHQEPWGSAQAPPRLAPNPVFVRITMEQGLSDLRVTAIVQDHAGFMWLATTNGLDHYDGYNIVAYRSDPANPHSLSGNFIETLYEDRPGTLWVGTRSGLNAFDRRIEQFIRYLHDEADPRSLSNNSVLAIAEERSGVLGIGTTVTVMWSAQPSQPAIQYA